MNRVNSSWVEPFKVLTPFPDQALGSLGGMELFEYFVSVELAVGLALDSGFGRRFNLPDFESGVLVLVCVILEFLASGLL